MPKIILVVMMLFTHQGMVIAGDDPHQRAMDVFIKLQDGKTDTLLNAQISELIQSGHKRGGTSAAYIGGGCGVAGCSATYLVTSSYYGTDVNPRSLVVAAIVFGFPEQEMEILKILTRTEIENLGRSK